MGRFTGVSCLFCKGRGRILGFHDRLQKTSLFALRLDALGSRRPVV